MASAFGCWTKLAMLMAPNPPPNPTTRLASAQRLRAGMPIMDEKSKAQHILNQKVRSGKIVRPDACSRCGDKPPRLRDGRSAIQGHHHRGYDHPLDVEWLCVSCHRDETPAPYGSRAGAAKVGWDRVDTIREMYSRGEQILRIAEHLGLERTTVGRIARGTSWPEHARPLSALVEQP